MNTNNVIVCDTGTKFTRVGFAGTRLPSVVIPTLVGTFCSPFSCDFVQKEQFKDIFVGDEVLENYSSLVVHSVISGGIMKNFEALTLIWGKAFKKLEIEPQKCKILLTSSHFSFLDSLEKEIKKIEDIMLNHFGFSGVKVCHQALLAAYSQEIKTALVCDFGEDYTYVVPIHNGVIQKRYTRTGLGGKDMTRLLYKRLLCRGYQFHEKDIEVQNIKEKLGYIAYDFERELQLNTDSNVLVADYTLPDGRNIKIGKERFEAPECLFSALADFSGGSISELVFICNETSTKFDKFDKFYKFEKRENEEDEKEVRKKLYENILVCGNGSLFPGLSSRLEREVKENINFKMREKLQVKVIAPTNGGSLVYLGASMMAENNKDNEYFWVKKE